MSTRHTIKDYLIKNYPDIYKDYLTVTRNNRLEKNRKYIAEYRKLYRVKCENCDKIYAKGQHKRHDKTCSIRGGHNFLDD